jgi:hypothetical protein
MRTLTNARPSWLSFPVAVGSFLLSAGIGGATVIGCGGASSASPVTDGGHELEGGSPSDGAPGAEGGPAEGDHVADSGAGPTGDGGTPAGAIYTGDVTATVIGNGATYTYGVVAEFAPTIASPACPGTMMGACCFEPAVGTDAAAAADAGAPADGGASGDGGGVAPPNAGTIAVTDGPTMIATVMPSPAPGSGGYGVPQGVAMWTAGDTLGVTAPGGAVHAFMGSVKAVSAFAGVTPDLTQSLTIGRSTDLVVTWTADSKTTGSNVAFALADGNGNAIACQVADSAGTATMPAALLAKTSAGSAVVSLTRTLGTIAADDNTAVSIQSAALSVGNASLE